jgi:hypothetical protein
VRAQSSEIKVQRLNERVFGFLLVVIGEMLWFCFLTIPEAISYDVRVQDLIALFVIANMFGLK